jgi:hypothetical protein
MNNMEEYKLIEELVMKYKEPDNRQQYAQELLQRFELLVYRYANIIFRGWIDFNHDTDIKFLRLFIEDEVLRNKLKAKKLSFPEREAIKYNLRMAKLSKYKNESYDSVVVDIQIRLLDLARRYEDVGKNFCAYVSFLMPFELHRMLFKSMRSPLSVLPIIEDNEEVFSDIHQSESYCKVNQIDILLETFDEDKTSPFLKLITGIDGSEHFNQLTERMKLILVNYFIKNCNDQQIADSLCMHINTVNTEKRKALAMLSKSLNREYIRTRKSGKLTNNA